MNKKTYYSSLYTISLLIALVTGRELYNLFIHLTDTQLFDWDESRHGISAIEMISNNNYLINTYGFTPDYWSLKPILSYIPMILGMKVFGESIFGLRIVSVVASMVTFGLLTFTGYRLQGYALALTTASIYSCWPVYMIFHGARSGDPDAVYILWYVTAITLLICKKEITPNDYLTAGIFCALAFLTKSFHAVTLGLTLSIFALIDFKAINNRVKAFSFLAIGTGVPVLIWAILRWKYDQFSFLGRMIGTDIIQRSSEAIEGHSAPWYFYFEYIWHESQYWLIISGAGLIFLAMSKRIEGLIAYAPSPSAKLTKILVTAAAPIVLFSIAKTKLTWYVSPSLPFISLALALIFIETNEYAKRLMPYLASTLKICVAAVYFYYQFVIGEQMEKISQSKEPVKTVIENIANSRNCRGCEVFLSSGAFSQSQRLTVMMSDGLTSNDGGITAFNLSDNPQKLLIKNE